MRISLNDYNYEIKNFFRNGENVNEVINITYLDGSEVSPFEEEIVTKLVTELYEENVWTIMKNVKLSKKK